MTWTEQKIQALKDMWGHGYSASEIAKQLGGLTRNAVIGKAHRLKLSAGAASDKASAMASGVVNPVAGQGVSASMKSPRKRVMLRPLPVVPTPASTTITKQPAAATARDAFVSFDNVKRTEGIAVTKAGDRHCRWPVGDPRSPDFRFCGCSAYESLPYCIDHARVAYQNIGKKQRTSESSSHGSEFRLPGQSRF